MVSEASRVVDEQFRLLRDVFAGRGGDPLSTLHPEVTFFVPGPLPVSGTHDYAFLRDNVFGGAGPGVPSKDGFGHYPVEYIEEGNRVVVIAKARLNGRTGDPYNNTFFMFYEVRDGKIYRFIEFLDGSLFMQSNVDTHLEPEA
jgi:ketosteroid isomerase-like protein